MREVAYLSDADWSSLQEEVQKKNVSERKHSKFPIAIYTYTSQCEIEENWNPVTLRCRGLVVDLETHEIIINCIPKFFNQNTKFADNIDIEDPATSITLKEDGFLLQFTIHKKYGLIVTSKSSFESPMAKDACEYLSKREVYDLNPDLHLSYICEWCKDYPEAAGFIVTRHPKTRLVCFAIRNSLGQEFDTKSIILPSFIEKVREFTPSEAASYLTEKVEGVVLKNRDKRVKVKTQWFLETHRAISRCTKKTVWETLVRKEKVEDLENIPDEFYKKMLNWQNELLEAFEKEKAWVEEWEDTLFNIQNLSEKALALNTSLGFNSYQKGLIFSLHHNKIDKMEEAIWKKLKPKGGE